MKFLKGNSKRTTVFAVITLSLIIVLIGLNFLATFFGTGYTVFADMTTEGLYTLTDKMVEECKFIDKLGETDGDKKVRITFCTDPDYLIGSQLTRLTYFMAIKMSHKFDNLEVKIVNVDLHPTELSMYKTTSLSKINATDVIVSYGDRYRIVGASNFWTTGSDGSYFSYNGEYKLATLIKSVTAVDQPAAYFITGHGETYYNPAEPESEMSKSTSSFADLLLERGLVVKTLDLSAVDAIPDDCALLIINNPTSDFVADPSNFDDLSVPSDLEKIDRYLVDRQGALAVARDYARVDLDNLDDFLHEWGFDFSNSIVKDEEMSVADEDGTGTTLITVYDTNEENYANAIYGEFASLESAPRMIISNTGYIKCAYGMADSKNEAGASNISKIYSPFLMASSGAKSYAKAPDGSYIGSSVLENAAGGFDLAAVTTRQEVNSETAESEYSYVFCSASPDFFSNELLGSAYYANYEITAALINNMSRVDYYASMDLGGTSLNSSSLGGKQLVTDELSTEDRTVYSTSKNEEGKYEIVKVNSGISNATRITFTVIVALVPLAAATVGTVICVKRKFL